MSKAQKLIFSCMFVLAGCGSVELASPEPPHEEPKAPFTFETIGDYLRGLILIDLVQLPSGKWVVLAHDGNLFLTDENFKEIGHDFVPANLYGEGGVFSIVLDNDFLQNELVYFYATIHEPNNPLCQTNNCTAILKARLDETEESFLQEIETILLIPYLNREGHHYGGGMTFGPDGFLYLATGDGMLSDPKDPLQITPQLENNPLGKLLKIDPTTGAYELAGKGFRNPFSAVQIPQGMLIGDVGDKAWEEINLYEYGSDFQNFGWPLNEGPTEGYNSPVAGFKHCESGFDDADPETHTKNHMGVEHPCGEEIVSALGLFDEEVVYSDPYAGWVRSFRLQGGKQTEDRHIAHFPGLSACHQGADGFLYCVSMFASNSVLKMIPQ